MEKYKSKFVYSGYWRTWSRILDYKDDCFVEVDLTPVNPTVASEWNKVAQINIRRHRTNPLNNRFANTLDSEVLGLMSKWLSLDVIERLLHEDFLPSIDWDRYAAHNNGGAVFSLIKKDDR